MQSQDFELACHVGSGDAFGQTRARALDDVPEAGQAGSL